MKNRNFRSIIILYTAYAWFMKIDGALIPAYLHQSGTSINALFTANAVQFIPMLFVLVILRIQSAKVAWTLSLITGLLSILSIVNLQSQYQVYLSYIFGGASIALFFVFYNVGHFLYTPKEKTGFSGGIMYAIGPLVSIVAPLLAGILVTYSLNYLWIATVISFCIALLQISHQAQFKVTYTLTQAYHAVNATRIPIFLEGIWESVLFAIIPVLTLNFISGLTQYGQYLAYLSLVGTVAGIILGKYTDKKGKRSYLLWPISLSLAVLTVALAYSQTSLTLWIVTTSLIQMLVPLFWNITTTLVVDQGGDLRLVFPGREIVLATGRLLGLSITAILVSLGQTNLVLWMLAFVLLLLPTYLYYQSHILRRYHYL